MASLPSPTSPTQATQTSISQTPAPTAARRSPPASNSSCTPGPAVTPTSWTFSSVQSSTPAKRSSPTEQERASKRHSPPFPTAGTPSPNSARAGAGSASAEAAVSGVSTTASQMGSHTRPPQPATPSGSHASGQIQASPSLARTQAHLRSHSATSAQPQSGPASSSLGADDRSTSQMWTRRRSLTSVMPQRPLDTFDFTGELAPSSSLMVPASQDQNAPQPNREAADNRARLSTSLPGHTSVTRSSAFPRGLEQEEAYGDLSILGYPMPQRLPDRRAPERMADMPDEWGLLSELGPMSRTDLFSVGDWESAVPSDVEFLVRTGQAVPPVAARRPVRHATRLVGLPPPPMPETAPPPGSLLTQAAHDLELVEARVRRLEREVMDADQTEQAAGDSDSFLTHLRPTGRIVEEQAQREADLSRRSGAREQTTSARGTEILQQISAGGSQTPQPNGASRRAVVTVVPQPSAPSAETPVAAPALGTRTTVPRVERNDAVRDWRNGVAQQPQLPPSTPWDAQPTAASSSQARRQAPSTRPHGGPHVHNWSRWRSEVGQHDTARSAVDPRILYQFDHRWTPISPAAAAGTSGHPREAGPTPIATFARSPVNDASLDYGPNPFEHPATRPEPGTSSIRTRNLAWRRGMRELGREREPDMAGAPPPATSGLRPFLLGTHPPFRASPNWDESGRPSNRLANAAGRHVPSTASSAHATAGDPPAVPRSDGSRPHSVVPQYPDPSITDIDFELAHNPFSTPGFDTVNSYVHSPYITGSPLQSLFRPSERSPAPVSAFANTGRADGGDPVDLSGRTLRRSGTQPGLVPPPTGALGSAAQPQSLTPASFPARPRYGSSLSMFVHEDLYMRMANANTDPEERAVRLLAVALLTIDPQGFINGKVSTPDDFRLRSEMAPQSRTQLFTRAARAVAIFPMLNRRQFMTNVLIRSRWMDARVEGDKDECCPICQDDYEPSQVVWVTPCNHMYHGSCLERWIKTPNVSSCPMCRRDLALLHATSLLCREGTEVARKIWMQMPTDLVPPREH